MNPALLFPLGLAALAAMVVPLAIHLARRSERRPTDFAALRWLQAQARPRHHLRLDEWLLLALRLLLVAALALLLARPVLFGTTDAPAWIVAAPGVDAARLRSEPPPPGAATVERRWLAPGFPDASAMAPAGPAALGSLLRELDATLPAGAGLAVLVPERLDGADAERPRLSRPVDWRVVAAAAGGKPEDDTASARIAPMPTLFVRHAADRRDGLRYLRAAAAAWHAGDASRRGPDATPADVAETGTPLPREARLLAWLAPGPLPDATRDWIIAGGVALLDAEQPALEDATVLWRDDAGEPLLRGAPLGRGRVLQWTRALRPAEMPILLDGTFAGRLRSVLAPTPAPARAVAEAYAPTTGAAPWPQAPRDLGAWLALLIGVLFLVERWLASSPRRREAA